MTFIFDISRILRRSQRLTPTGIDRVDLAYAQYFLDHEPGAIFCFGRNLPRVMPHAKLRKRLSSLAFMQPASENGDFSPAFVKLVKLLARSNWISPAGGGVQKLGNADDGRKTGLARVLSALKQDITHRPLPPSLRGYTYLNTSHTGLEDARFLSALSSRGARIVSMIHDTIPIDYPEFCRLGEDSRHHARLMNMQHYCARLLSVSAYTQSRLKYWAQKQQLRLPPQKVIPLAASSTIANACPGKAIVSSVPYFVTLGTIEARKNHMLLLGIWKRLIEKFKGAAPRLVIAGHRGWKVPDVTNLLDRDPDLGRAVVEASGLADSEIALLMKHSRAVLQPSLAEGFGLPLIEAAAVGAQVIASGIPAHREVAGKNCCFVDANDFAAWFSLIKQKTEASPAIGNSTVPAWSWDDHVATAVAFVRDCSASVCVANDKPISKAVNSH